MKNKIVYISGPMSGVENYNFTLFNKVAYQLQEKGYEVINPAEIGLGENWTWEQYMKADIAEMMKADVIAILPDWDKSKGASLEVYIAKKLGIPVIDYLWFLNFEDKKESKYNTSTESEFLYEDTIRIKCSFLQMKDLEFSDEDCS